MQRVISLLLPLSVFAGPLLADSAMKGVLLSVAVLLAALLLRKRSASVRHAVWLAGMCGLLILPLLAAWLPAWHVLPEWYALGARAHDDTQDEDRSPGAIKGERTTAEPARHVELDLKTRIRLIKTDAIRIPTPARGTPDPSVEQPAKLAGTQANSTVERITSWIVSVWAAVAAWMLLRLVCGQIALWRLCRHAERLDQSRWRDQVHGLCAELGISTGGLRPVITVWKLKTRVIPMAWGIFRPRVVLPCDVDSWSDERTRAVLLHELAHIKRRDCLTQWIAELARAMHWFNPLVWLAISRMRIERERACDDLVLGRGLTASTYADQLVHMTAEYPSLRFQLPLAAAMARSTGLEHRVRRILDTRLDRQRLTRLGLGMLIGLVVTVLLPLSMLDRRVAATESPVEEIGVNADTGQPQPPDVATVKQPQQSPPKLRYDAQPKHGIKEIELDGRLIVETRLINEGAEPVNVYWGDYAYPSMYEFDIRHDASKQRLPTTRLPVHEQMVPKAAQRRYFRTIEPGTAVTYDIHLSSALGGNAQRVHFSRPGIHVITPTLRVTTGKVLDGNTGVLSQLPNTWTGTLEALPFIVNVKGETAVLIDGIEVNGTVATHTGKPAAGAIVQATHRLPSFGAFDGFSEQIVGQAYADKQGRFQMVRLPGTSSSYRFTAWIPEHPLGSKQLINDGKTRKQSVSIDLPRGVIVQGRVVDDKGEPVTGVRVSSLTRTGEDGRFTLSSMPASEEYSVNLWRRGYVGIIATTDHKTATGGDWTIKLVPEREVKLKGIARFANGDPIGNSKVEFKLTPLDASQAQFKGTRGTRCETTSDGTFTVTLPESIEYSGVATAFEPGEHNIGRTWKSTIPKLSASSERLQLVFDNRHRIKVSIAHTNELPASLTFNVSCRLENRRTMEEQKVSVGNNNVLFDRLSSGDYQVSVVVASAEHWNWSRDVTVPAGDPHTADVTVRIPELHFGDIVAKFVMPDGVTPLRNSRISIDSFSGWGSRQTDDAGQLLIKTLPAGRLQLTARGVNGVAESPVVGQVEGGKLNDLGTFRLKREEDVYGWVEGTLKYDDGSPVLGAMTNGTAIGISTNGNMQPRGFRGASVGQTGQYRVRMPAGTHELTFDLTSAAGWMGANSKPVSFRHRFHPDGGFDQLTVRVNIEAGKTIKRDMVLKRTQEKRKLNIKWDLPETERVNVTTVVESDGIRLTKTVWGPSGDDSDVKTPVIKLDSVPEGHCTVILRTHTGPYFMVKTVDTTQPEPTVEFDSDDCSQLAIRVSGPDGEPLRGLGLSVTTYAAGQLVGACVINPAMPGQPDYNKPAHRAFHQLDDGTMVVSGLGQGDYSVSITNGEWKHEHTVTLGKDAGAIIEWTLDEKGKSVKRTQKPLAEGLLDNP